MQTSSDRRTRSASRWRSSTRARPRARGCGARPPAWGRPRTADADIADLPSGRSRRRSVAATSSRSPACARATPWSPRSGAGMDLLLAAKWTGPRGKRPPRAVAACRWTTIPLVPRGRGSLPGARSQRFPPRWVTDSRFAGLALRWNYWDMRGAILHGGRTGRAGLLGLAPRLDHPAPGSDGRALSLGYRWETYRSSPTVRGRPGGRRHPGTSSSENLGTLVAVGFPNKTWCNPFSTAREPARAAIRAATSAGRSPVASIIWPTSSTGRSCSASSVAWARCHCCTHHSRPPWQGCWT